MQDYGFRLYNPSIGKFLSVDPLSRNYPYFTPYQFAGNSPIKFIDLDGLESVDPMDVVHKYGLSPNQIWNAAVDGSGNILLAGFEYSVSDGFEGGAVRVGLTKQGVSVSDDITDEQLGALFKISKKNREIKVVFEEGLISDLKELGISAIDVLAILSPAKTTGFLAKVPAAIIMGQIFRMTNSTHLSKTAADLLEVVKDFDNKIYNVGKNSNLILDKAGMTHILGRHHPKFRLGPDKKLQSNFSPGTTVTDITDALNGIIKKYSTKIEKMVKGNLKDVNGNTVTSSKFEYKGKTYQLGIDQTSKSRVGQFFEITN